MDDELDKSRRLDRMRKQLEEQQRQLEERARQLLQGQRLHQDDLQELETYQKQQLQQFDEQQEQMQRGSELSPEELVSLELPATSLPVISEHPEYSLLDEMQQQQMQELQRLQFQWQHEQEQLQQKLQETLRLPEDRRCAKAELQDTDEESSELPAETSLQLAPSPQDQNEEPQPAPLSSQEAEEQTKQDALAETLQPHPAQEATAEANADGEVFSEQETDAVKTVRPGLEHLDAALAALQKSYRSSHHSAYEQHTSFLDKIGQFDQRCLALVTQVELSNMPQTSSAGASAEEGGRSDVLQLGSLVEKLTEFIGMSSKPADKEAPVSPSPQERVTLSGRRRWPPGPQVRPGPPAPGPESAE